MALFVHFSRFCAGNYIKLSYLCAAFCKMPLSRLFPAATETIKNLNIKYYGKQSIIGNS